jgi:DNA-binding winged helix-turn-helix (wHTH) protein
LRYDFEDHVLDTERVELRRGPELVELEPQVFDLLVYLIQNQDRVISTDELFDVVWQGRIVSLSTLTSRINAARKAIGDSGAEQKLIKTIPRKGYRSPGRQHPLPPKIRPSSLSSPNQTSARRYNSAHRAMACALLMPRWAAGRRW